MLPAIVELPHTAVSGNYRLVHIVNVMLADNSDRSLADLCEVFYHSLHGNTLPNWKFCIAMLYLNQYVFLIVVLNQSIDVCWVYPAVKTESFEVNELLHTGRILNLALHMLSAYAQTYSG